MPPKKKEEEVDLSTCPECPSTNCILLCKGKPSRASKILQSIYDSTKYGMSQINYDQVLTHAA